MKIRYTKQALKYLRKMPASRAEDLRSALEQIAVGSQTYHGDLIRLSNSRFFSPQNRRLQSYSGYCR
jgi:phage-related protein